MKMAEETLMRKAPMPDLLGEDDLLATIDLYKDEDDPNSKREVSIALSELLRRHEEYLLAVARYVAKDFPLLDYGIVYNEYASRLVSHTQKFSFDVSSARTIEKQFLSQAGKFIEYVVKEELKNSSSERLDNSYILSVSSNPEQEVSVEALELRDIMDEVLNEKEKQVLWAWNLVIPLDGGSGRTSSDDVKNLAASLQTTAVNIRKIRSRAFLKIREAAPHFSFSI